MIATKYTPENGHIGIEWSDGSNSYRSFISHFVLHAQHTECHWLSQIRIGEGDWEPRPALAGILTVTDQTHRSLATMEIVPAGEGTIGEQTLFRKVFGTAEIESPQGIYDFGADALVRKLNTLNIEVSL